MKPNRTSPEIIADIFFGQIVLVWARWFFIGAAIVLALLGTATPAELTGMLLVALVLMAINGFIHARYLMEKPANRWLLLAASLLDVVMILGLILGWRGGTGLRSQFFIFFYPLLFAFALVFPPRLAVAYTALVVGLYALVGIALDPAAALSLSGVQTLGMRLITLAAMGGLGAYYYRAQRAARPA
jgi:hypothetical protein